MGVTDIQHTFGWILGFALPGIYVYGPGAGLKTKTYTNTIFCKDP